MSTAVSKAVKKVKNKLGVSSPSRLTKYAEFVVDEPIDDKAFLLESRHGDAFEGNMYYLARAILASPEYSDYRVYIPARASRRDIVEAQVESLPGSPTIVELDSVDYYHALATSKYLFNDTSFEHCFYKRPDQVYINTWHGTPLKRLGRGVHSERVRMSNVQRGFLCADYLLYPNEHTKNAVFQDYMMSGLYQGNVLYSGYPRNEVFFDNRLRNQIRERFNLEGKRVYAFMPTYRGLNHALHASQNDVLKEHLSVLDSQLNSDELIYVNLHPFMAGAITCDGYEHIRMFPSEVPSYDFLSATDALITDYSSVMFDFACSRRPIVLFTYDLEEYMGDRGVYLSVKDLPLTKVSKAEDVLPALRSMHNGIDATFVDEFCAFDCVSASIDLVNLAVHDVASGKMRLEVGEASKKEKVLCFVDGFDCSNVVKTIKSYFGDSDLADREYYLSFPRTDEFSNEIIDSLDGTPLSFYSLGGKIVTTGEEKVLTRSYKAGNLSFEEYFDAYNPALKREWQRRYGNVKFDRAVSLGVYKRQNIMLAIANCENVELVGYREFDGGLAAPAPSEEERSAFIASGVSICNNPLDWIPIASPSTVKGGGYALIRPKFHLDSNGISISAFMKFTVRHTVSLNDFRILIGDKLYEPHVRLLSGDKVESDKLNGTYYCRLRLAIPKSDLLSFSINNYMRAMFMVNDHPVSSKPIKYNWLNFGANYSRSKKLYERDAGLVAFFRATKRGNIALTVRNINVTDSPRKLLKLKVAVFLAKLPLPTDRPILIFEKNSSKYEEGGKVLFEYLVDHGYRNVRFIIDSKTFDELNSLEDKYRDQMLITHSWAHYISFFRSRTFIGTETMAHAIELRVDEKYAKKKLSDANNTYVFLQHGPTYMVSLDSPQRTFFRRSEQPGAMYIACNSPAEKNHFVELGGFEEGDLLVSGMPKFDTAVMDDGADKIVIMPTWRPWEFNELRVDPKATKYWKMIEEIRDAIPASLQDKVVVQAHPLFNVNEGGAIRQQRNIDELLRRTKVLITDYSSVAYDAFYRGANVVFFWREKDECMEQYGEPTHLMIDENTAPGFVCYCQDDIKNVIENAYCDEQPSEFVERFRKIVCFHDGKNTERLVSMLLERGII